MHKRHFACTSHPSEVLRAPATVPISSEALSIRAWASHLDCWQLGVDCVSAYQPTRDTGPSGNLQLPFGRVAARPVCTHPTAHPAAVTSAMAAARPPAAAVEAQVTSGTEPQQTTNLSFTRAMTHAAGRISWDMRASIWAMAATGPMHGATRRSVPCRPTHTPTRLVVYCHIASADVCRAAQFPGRSDPAAWRVAAVVPRLQGLGAVVLRPLLRDGHQARAYRLPPSTGLRGLSLQN